MRTIVFVLLMSTFGNVAALHHNREDACSCLNWKETYSGGVTCGRTEEFHPESHQAYEDSESGFKVLEAVLGDKYCTKFYEKLDGNYCVNVNIGKDEGQWCFVDSSCSDLNGGGPVNQSSLNYKMCGTGDAMLRDSSPEALAELATSAHLDLAFVFSMSYPKYEENGKLWKDVAAFWKVPQTAFASLPVTTRVFMKPKFGDGIISEGMYWEMKEIADSGIGYLFEIYHDEKDRPPPGEDKLMVITQGQKMYLMSKTPGEDSDKLVCMSGC
jgi:hypothetical protein